ncbi:hypothetical protein BJ742DRAFT_810152 [Cladochytrium replicatum]|nr:hypothetical protein BJ742DRAFT_810152 [Cladochytrium replicatum]
MSGLGSGLDPDVFGVSVAATCVAAGEAVGFTAVLAWRLKQLGWPKTPFRRWARYQKLSIGGCWIGIFLYMSSMLELVLVMYISPENLAKAGDSIPGVWNKGALKFFVSLSETMSQFILSFWVFSYFLILMERFAAFRFLLPVRIFRLLYTPFLIFGTMLFLLMMIGTIIININVTALTESETSDLVLATSSLLLFCVFFELVLSISLCRTFFIRSMGQRRQESWSLSRGGDDGYISHIELQHQRKGNLPSSQISLSSTSYPHSNSALDRRSGSTSDGPTIVPPLTNHSNNSAITLRPAAASTTTSRSDTYSLATVLRDPYKRRTIWLFGGIVLSDLLGVSFYVLSLLPETEKIGRPIEVMVRCSIGFHFVLALIFLESFRQILHPENSAFVVSTAVLTAPEFL